MSKVYEQRVMGSRVAKRYEYVSFQVDMTRILRTSCINFIGDNINISYDLQQRASTRTSGLAGPPQHEDLGSRTSEIRTTIL
jgi:hypothetical protein